MIEPETNYTLIHNLKDCIAGLLTIASNTDMERPTAEAMCDMLDFVARIYRDYAEIEFGVEKVAEVIAGYRFVCPRCFGDWWRHEKCSTCGKNPQQLEDELVHPVPSSKHLGGYWDIDESWCEVFDCEADE